MSLQPGDVTIGKSSRVEVAKKPFVKLSIKILLREVDLGLSHLDLQEASETESVRFDLLIPERQVINDSEPELKRAGLSRSLKIIEGIKEPLKMALGHASSG